MKKVFFGMTAVSAVMCFLAGCVTSVPVSYTEPAKLDLSGVRRVAVDSDDSRVEASVTQKLSATGRYTVAPAAELAQWKLWNYQRQSTEVGSADLVQAYGANVARADSTYKGKLLLITSTVQQIQQDSSGRYYVRFEGTGDNAVVVFFSSSEENRIADLDNGQTVTVIGECTGRDLPDMTDTAQILQILGGGQPVVIKNATFQIEAPPVEAVISLKTVVDVQEGTRTEQEAAYDSNGKRVTGADGKPVYRNVTVYERGVTVNISHQVVRARDGSIMGQPGTETAESGKSSDRDRSRLPTAADLVARTIEQPLTSLVVPTQRSISITLAKESDNSAAKKEMGAADKMVKAKDYAGAAAAYGEVYTKHKNFAAGYNQAVLTEVASGTATAVGLMEAVAQANPGNVTAQTTLRDMRARNSANQRSAAQSAN